MVTKDEHINNILALHFSGEKLNDEQEKDLVDWICENKSEYKKLSELMTSTEAGETPGYNTEKAWHQVSMKLKPTRKHTYQLMARYISYAACIVLVAGISLFFLNRNEKSPLSYYNTTEDLMAVMLPDSTTVTLYPGARLTYQEDGTSAERKTELGGKAFFKVKRNPERPFIVDNYRTNIKVLGTSFLVNGTDSLETGVYVREGRVQVSTSHQNVILTADEQAVVTDQGIRKSEISNSRELFSKFSVQKSYQDELLTTVLKDIEEEFKVQITVDPSLQNNRITTTLHFDRLEEVLNEIGYICDGKYRKVSEGQFKLYKSNN